MNGHVLCQTTLDAKEQARLLGLLDALAGYLGSPGDWGYGTRLGQFTIDVIEMRQSVRDARMAGDDPDPDALPQVEFQLTQAGEIEPIRAGGTD